jgi:hypothetical protein
MKKKQSRFSHASFQKTWCPLFGKLPSISYSPNPERRCIDIIHAARDIWGVASSIPFLLKTSWPDPSEIPDYPPNKIRSARYIYGARQYSHYSKSDLKNDVLYEMYYGISKEWNLEFDVDKETQTVQENLNDLIMKGSFDEEIPLHHALAIRAIKLAWDALDNIIGCNELNLDRESIYRQIHLADSLVALADKIKAHDELNEIRPLARKGRGCVEGGRRGGQAKAITNRETMNIRHSMWQAEADVIWQKNPRRSKSWVAVRVARKCGGKANTIRRQIKKKEDK